jgi:hypothetical protein
MYDEPSEQANYRLWKKELGEQTPGTVEGRVTLQIQRVRGKVTSGKLYLVAWYCEKDNFGIIGSCRTFSKYVIFNSDAE